MSRGKLLAMGCVESMAYQSEGRAEESCPRSTNMRDCFSIEVLRSWLAHELSLAEQGAVSTHVTACAVCQARLDADTDLATLRSWLNLGPECPFDDADLAITEKLLGERDGPRRRTEKVVERPCGQRARPAEVAEPKSDIGRVGSFRFLDELGRGGMGIVYRAWDEPLRRIVAVKLLRPEHAGAADRLRLVREAQFASRFQNDHAVTIHAVVDPPDGLPYLVMEYVAGPTLAELISSGDRPPPRELAGILAQAAVAVDAAHAAGLVHRDVKPSNILIDASTGRAKITDFGVARTLAAPSTITREGTVAGTPAYMSPEQARGDPNLDPRTDVYSLGATFYEGLTGQPPFAGALHAILRRIVEEDPIPPRRFDYQLPADLETICLKAMAKEPAGRYQTARDFGDDLNRWLRNEPIHARPANRIERAWHWCRRRPSVAGLALALIVVMTSGVAGISWKWAEAVSERQRTEIQRDRALRNFRQAREAVDTYLTQVSDNDVLKAQNLEPLRRDLLRTARDFYERFVEQDPDDPELQADLGKAHERLGLITSVLESTPKALEHFQRMGAIFNRLHETYPDNLAYQKELAESYRRQGESIRAGAGRASEAEAHYQRGRALQADLVRARPAQPAYRHDLARSLRNLGNLYIFLANDYARAEEVLLEAREIHDGLPADYARQSAVQFEHALVLLNLAKLYAQTDRPQQDRAASEAAVALFEPLARAHEGDPVYAMHLTDSLSKLGESYRSLGEIELAATTLTKALEGAHGLARAHPANAYARHSIADIAYMLASLDFHERRQPAAARAMLQKAIDIEIALTIEFPAVSEYQFYVWNTLRDLRDWFGDTAALQAVLERFAVAIREHEARFAPCQRDEARLVQLHDYRAIIYTLLGRAGDALAESKNGRRPGFYFVALANAQNREYGQAESAASALVGENPEKGASLYVAAQINAHLATVAAADGSLGSARRAELVESYGQRAVTLLERARSLRYLSAPSTRFLLTDDRDLEALRSRPDFQALLARHAAAAGPWNQ